MNKFLLLTLLATPFLLDGCYTPLIEGAQEGYDAARRDTLRTEAASEAPIAQYKLGNTYCCHGGGPMDNVSVYDNQEATHWYCKAARQGYPPAQMRLAQIYSGHPIRGVHIALRASSLIGTAETNLGVALMWANVAANQGAEGAIALRDEITAQATNTERERAATLVKHWHAAPCEWTEVISSVTRTRR